MKRWIKIAALGVTVASLLAALIKKVIFVTKKS